MLINYISHKNIITRLGAELFPSAADVLPRAHQGTGRHVACDDLIQFGRKGGLARKPPPADGRPAAGDVHRRSADIDDPRPVGLGALRVDRQRE